MKKKKALFLLSPISLIAVSPIISCSNSNINKNLSQDDIDKQYNYFHNSLINQKVQDNLYFENFNFNDNNKTDAYSIEEISKILSITNLSDSYDYRFFIEKINDSSIQIQMQMSLKNENNWNLEPIDKNLKYITLNNIKYLDENIISTINGIYSIWSKNSADNLEIKNKITNQVLNKDNFSNCLPSFLDNQNIEINFKNIEILSKTIENNNLKESIVFSFNDIEGTIEAKLNIENSTTSLKYFFSNFSNIETIVIEGFANSKEKYEEVINMYSILAKTFNLKNILKDVEIPFLASGINSIEKAKLLFQEINKLIENQNKNIVDILNLLENISNNNEYFLSLKTFANDSLGSLTLNWTICDSFSGFEINVEAISNITTINELKSLVISVDNNGTIEKDYSQIQNGYNAYYGFKKLIYKFNNNQNKKASEIIYSEINNDWLINNTNIKDIFPDISIKDDYIYFSTTSNKITNNFRLKIDSNLLQNHLISNDINGLLSFPFIMQIEIKINEENQWLDFFPPSKIIEDSNGNISYDSATRSEDIYIGGFITNIESSATIFYDKISKIQEITINIENKEYFNSIFNEIKYNEKIINQLLETEIKNEVINLFSENIEQQTIIENILSNLIIVFDFKENSMPSYNSENKTITTSLVNIYLSDKNSSSNVLYYSENGELNSFPKCKIIIKLI